MRDREKIDKTFAHMHTMGTPYWLVSFLEGTRQTPEKYASSVTYAKKKDLPVLKHLLLPRTKGFVATVQSLRNDRCKALYDLTIAYAGDKPGLFTHTDNCNVYLHVRRYELNELPTTEQDLHDFCLKLWVQKDELLDHFAAHGAFPGSVLDLPAAFVPSSW
eukprot:TRINITY_DN1483_c0_g1_i3.p2 TRINITY_DN1483_c0_g1~~TRINITY_DN1483_c0_g1_i3.p2  ORF type:complete len:161 (-),score=46.50 TRINITY_DN1483_c0_g1_i3:39-521(-)